MARIAIEKLSQIQPDDKEREKAFKTVKEYIDENCQNGKDNEL